MSHELRDLAATAALGSLSADELGALRDEAARDAALAAELAQYRSVVLALEAGVAREPAPEGLLDGVLSRVEAEEQAATPLSAERRDMPAEPMKRRARWSWRPRSFVPVFAAGFVTTAAVAALAFVLGMRDGLGPTTAVATLQGKPRYAAVHGRATLHDATERDGHLVLRLDDVPAPPPGEHYEVWVLRAESKGQMEAVGVFVPSRRNVKLDLGLPGPGDYRAIDVSIQRDGGPPEHSGTSLAGGTFASPGA